MTPSRMQLQLKLQLKPSRNSMKMKHQHQNEKTTIGNSDWAWYNSLARTAHNRLIYKKQTHDDDRGQSSDPARASRATQLHTGTETKTHTRARDFDHFVKGSLSAVMLVIGRGSNQQQIVSSKWKNKKPCECKFTFRSGEINNLFLLSTCYLTTPIVQQQGKFSFRVVTQGTIVIITLMLLNAEHSPRVTTPTGSRLQLEELPINCFRWPAPRSGLVVLVARARGGQARKGNKLTNWPTNKSNTNKTKQQSATLDQKVEPQFGGIVHFLSVFGLYPCQPGQQARATPPETTKLVHLPRRQASFSCLQSAILNQCNLDMQISSGQREANSRIRRVVVVKRVDGFLLHVVWCSSTSSFSLVYVVHALSLLLSLLSPLLLLSLSLHDNDGGAGNQITATTTPQHQTNFGPKSKWPESRLRFRFNSKLDSNNESTLLQASRRTRRSNKPIGMEVSEIASAIGIGSDQEGTPIAGLIVIIVIMMIMIMIMFMFMFMLMAMGHDRQSEQELANNRGYKCEWRRECKCKWHPTCSSGSTIETWSCGFSSSIEQPLAPVAHLHENLTILSSSHIHSFHRKQGDREEQEDMDLLSLLLLVILAVLCEWSCSFATNTTTIHLNGKCINAGVQKKEAKTGEQHEDGSQANDTKQQQKSCTTRIAKQVEKFAKLLHNKTPFRLATLSLGKHETTSRISAASIRRPSAVQINLCCNFPTPMSLSNWPFNSNRNKRICMLTSFSIQLENKRTGHQFEATSHQFAESEGRNIKTRRTKHSILVAVQDEATRLKFFKFSDDVSRTTAPLLGCTHLANRGQADIESRICVPWPRECDSGGEKSRRREGHAHSCIRRQRAAAAREDGRAPGSSSSQFRAWRSDAQRRQTRTGKSERRAALFLIWDATTTKPRGGPDPAVMVRVLGFLFVVSLFVCRINSLELRRSPARLDSSTSGRLSFGWPPLDDHLVLLLDEQPTTGTSTPESNDDDHYVNWTHNKQLASVMKMEPGTRGSMRPIRVGNRVPAALTSAPASARFVSSKADDDDDDDESARSASREDENLRSRDRALDKKTRPVNRTSKNEEVDKQQLEANNNNNQFYHYNRASQNRPLRSAGTSSRNSDHERPIAEPWKAAAPSGRGETRRPPTVTRQVIKMNSDGLIPPSASALAPLDQLLARSLVASATPPGTQQRERHSTTVVGNRELLRTAHSQLAAGSTFSGSQSGTSFFVAGLDPEQPAPSKANCPGQCQCTWKMGKLFADCSSSNSQRGPLDQSSLVHVSRLSASGAEQMTSHHQSPIPSGLDPLLQVLNLTGIPIRILKFGSFTRMQLNNLQRIYLSRCQIEAIEEGAFVKLKLVVELDLSWNKLTQIPLFAVQHFSLMRRFTMRGNPLRRLDESSFAGWAPSDQGTAGAAHPTNDGRLQPEPGGQFANLSALAIQLLAKGLPELTGSERDRLGIQLSGFLETYPTLANSLAFHWGPGNQKPNSNKLQLQHHPQQLELSPLMETLRSLVNMTMDLAKADISNDLISNNIDVESLDSSNEADGDPSSEAGLEIDPDSSNHTATESDFDASDGSLITLDPTDAANNNNKTGNQARKSGSLAMGFYWRQLQELDFGECQLTYIKWTTFEHLHQLKRLFLDNNKLTQLSGRLVAQFPVGLHQLSLEENPWRCDCRLASLKRWLEQTRTPLSGPAKCDNINNNNDFNNEHHSHEYEAKVRTNRRMMTSNIPHGDLSHHSKIGMNRSNEIFEGNESSARQLQSKAENEGEERALFIDQMNLDHLVCPPQAIWPRPRNELAKLTSGIKQSGQSESYLIEATENLAFKVVAKGSFKELSSDAGSNSHSFVDQSHDGEGEDFDNKDQGLRFDLDSQRQTTNLKGGHLSPKHGLVVSSSSANNNWQQQAPMAPSDAIAAASAGRASAPLPLHQDQASGQRQANNHNKKPSPSKAASLAKGIANNQMTLVQLDSNFQLDLQEEQQRDLSLLDLKLVLDYLAPTLIRVPKLEKKREPGIEIGKGGGNKMAVATSAEEAKKAAAKPSPQLNASHEHSTFSTAPTPTHSSIQGRARNGPNYVVDASQADSITLNCDLLVYPESSLDIVWLADFQAAQDANDQAGSMNLGGSAESESHQDLELLQNHHQHSAGSILYDSRQHKSQLSPETNDYELFIRGSRLIIRESRVACPYESIIHKSQLIIKSAHPDLSARYKCLAANSAGKQSISYLVRVGRSAENNRNAEHQDGEINSARKMINRSDMSSRQRDSLVGHQSNANNMMLQHQQQTGSSSSNHQAPTSTTANQQHQHQHQHHHQRGSTTFQVTMFIVSGLMALVILAFCFFCALIYRMRPNMNGASGGHFQQPERSLGASRSTLAVGDQNPLGEWTLRPMPRALKQQHNQQTEQESNKSNPYSDSSGSVLSSNQQQQQQASSGLLDLLFNDQSQYQQQQQTDSNFNTNSTAPRNATNICNPYGTSHHSRGPMNPLNNGAPSIPASVSPRSMLVGSAVCCDPILGRNPVIHTLPQPLAQQQQFNLLTRTQMQYPIGNQTTTLEAIPDPMVPSNGMRVVSSSAEDDSSTSLIAIQAGQWTMVPATNRQDPYSPLNNTINNNNDNHRQRPNVIHLPDGRDLI